MDIQDQLAKFWEIEETRQPKLLSDEEQFCEESFNLTTKRNDDGRFTGLGYIEEQRQRRLQRILWRDEPTQKVKTYELNTVTYGTASASYLATRCLWRDEPTQKVKTYELNTVTYGTASASYLATRCIRQLATYELNTVTYGTASASYLATRCIRQLALDCKEQLPMVSRVIEQDFYVDDLLTGANEIEEATYIAQTVANILGSAGFELRKWLSNESRIVKKPHI
ncbi:hypothetical protein QE152_g19986 [Popillia japonica]|uniref:Uncharacterized protein n=1 Tax=Popillia japonica TaxID=7064 RepID=A0AAW1KNT8_POPJA